MLGEMAGDNVAFPDFKEKGGFRLAPLPPVGTAGLKGASLLQRLGSFLFFSRFLFPLLKGIQLRNRRKQQFCIRVQGSAKEILSVGHLYDLSEIHHGNPIADMLDDPEIVRNKEISEP
jgi:hypothetical protein